MVRLLRKKGQPIFILMISLTLLISVPFQPALAALIETVRWSPKFGQCAKL
jgi:hypothetical protein